jgi:predicted DNA-binding transcriptional regulator AlpA
MTQSSRKPPQFWEPRGDHPHDHATSHDPAHGSAKPQSDRRSHEPAPLLSKGQFSAYLGISYRSLDRVAAMGALPRPDLILGQSPRWSLESISRWLKGRPRLPGRGRR